MSGRSAGWLGLASLATAWAALEVGALATLLASPLLLAGAAETRRLLRHGPVQRSEVATAAALALVALLLANAAPFAGLLGVGLACTALWRSTGALLAPAPGAGLRGGVARAALAVDALGFEASALRRRLGRDPAERARDVLELAERARAEGWVEQPLRAHPRPPALEKPSLERVQLAGLPPLERLRAPHEPALASLPANAPNALEAWRLRRAGDRPALLVLAPVAELPPALWVRALGLDRLATTLDLEIACLPLPRAVEGDPAAEVMALLRAISAARRLAGHLRSGGAPGIGVLGIGRGGTAAACIAGLDPRLGAAVLDRPRANPARACLRTLSRPERLAFAAAGADEDALAAAYAPVAPLGFPPAAAPATRLLAAARADALDPDGSALRELAAAWNQPPIVWRSGGRLLPLSPLAWRTRLEAHLRATLLAVPAQTLPLTRFRGGDAVP